MRLRFTLALLSLAATALSQTVEAPQPSGVNFARTFPYSMTGKLIFSQGDDWFQGSGTLIRPSGVLTAAHNLWDADRGFSTDLIFRRSLYGEESAGDQYASRVYVLGGYRDKARSFTANDPRSFSQDLGAVLFSRPVALGSSAGWWANPALLLSGNPTIALGYGAQYHDGKELLSVQTSTSYAPVADAFYDNRSVYFEGGMSGGPVFARDAKGDLFVAGVVVAGTEDRQAGGVRVLDATAGAFIRAYLK